MHARPAHSATASTGCGWTSAASTAPPVSSCSGSARSLGVALPARLAPQLGEPAVAPTAESVRLVADRVLLVEVLVVFLGGPELGERHDRRHDRLLEPLRRGLELAPGFLGQPLLRFAAIEDLGSVLVAAIAELAARV